VQQGAVIRPVDSLMYDTGSLENNVKPTQF